MYRYRSDAPLQTFEELYSKRINPALASFYGDAEGLREYLSKLVSFAEERISSDLHAETAISLKATAGLRVIPLDEQKWIMREVHNILQNSNFSFSPAESRVLTGGEEALFGLLATNIAFSNLTDKLDLTMGAGDLGGSSQQIAFVIPPKSLMQSLLDNLWVTSASGVNNTVGDECRADFRITFPAASATEVVTAFTSPLSALVSMYSLSPSSLFSGQGSYSSLLGQTAASAAAAAQSLFGNSIGLCRPIVIEVYSRSMAGLGLVAAMNETFYQIAESHQQHLHRHFLLTQRPSSTNTSFPTLNSSRPILSNMMNAVSDDNDAKLCGSSLDLSDENERYCRAIKGHHDPSCDSSSAASSSIDAVLHDASVETNENNDGSHLYGQHSSWLHALRDTDILLANPCAPPGENLPYPDDLSTLRWQGTGNFDGCTRHVVRLLSEHAQQSDMRCLQQWQRQLPGVMVAMDNFPKVLEVMELPIDDLSAVLTPAAVRTRGQEICRIPWTELQERFPNYPAYRVQQVCFAASFIYAVMTEVYRLADNSFIPTSTSQVSSPSTTRFVAMDSHDSFTIGWALGAAVSSAMGITYEEQSHLRSGTAATTLTAVRSEELQSVSLPANDDGKSSLLGTARSKTVRTVTKPLNKSSLDEEEEDDNECEDDEDEDDFGDYPERPAEVCMAE